MKRFSGFKKRRAKLRTHWLEDQRFQRVFTASTSAGVLQTFPFSFTNTANQVMYDPAMLTWQAGATAPYQATVKNQLLQNRGFRMVRAVGELQIALAQAPSGPESATAAPFVAVTAALAVVDLEKAPTGTAGWGINVVTGMEYASNTAEWVLGTPHWPIDEEASAQVMLGMAKPWIWRRSWILQNYLANVTFSAGNWWGPGDQVVTANDGVHQSGVTAYALGKSSNDKYESIHLGAHFDIRRHATVGQQQALVWFLHAADLQGANNTWFELLVNRDYRVLLARPGRQFSGRIR